MNREQVFAFSDEYMPLPTGYFIVPKSRANRFDPNNITGKKIGKTTYPLHK